MTSTSTLAKSAPILTETETRILAMLETAFGDTLWAVLRSYLREGERHAAAVQDATACAHWQEAVRRGLALSALARDLEFRAVVQAARAFADAVYADHTAHARRNAAQLLLLEFDRSTLVLESRYPGLNGASVA